LMGLASLLAKFTLVANSKATASCIRPGRAQRRVHSIWNGVQQSVGREGPAEDGTIDVRVVGRFNWWKGQDDALRIALLLAEKTLPPWKLTLIGGAPVDKPADLEAVRKTIIENSILSVRVSVVDEQSEPWEDLFTGTGISLVPSKAPEPFGRVAVEAMSLGVPVVAVGHGGLTEIVRDGETGFLYPPRSLGFAADCLARLISDASLRGRFGQKALLRYESHFTPASSAQQYLKLYEEVIR
jgi:glycosyltransferase involved in cell wall biosynthesis